jgi:hypothetical protein
MQPSSQAASPGRRRSRGQAPRGRGLPLWQPRKALLSPWTALSPTPIPHLRPHTPRQRRRFGRKMTMLAGGLCFLVGTGLVAGAVAVPMLVVGRVVLGFGVGFACQVGPPPRRQAALTLRARRGYSDAEARRAWVPTARRKAKNLAHTAGPRPPRALPLERAPPLTPPSRGAPRLAPRPLPCTCLRWRPTRRAARSTSCSSSP